MAETSWRSNGSGIRKQAIVEYIWGHDTLMCGLGFQHLGLRSSARIAREVELASLFQFQLFDIGADILHYCRSSNVSQFRIGSESVA